jgi:hypothetical protein
MKKSNVFLLGLMVLAMGLILSSCASLLPAPKWDKAVPKDIRTTLVYHEGIRIEKIDGADKKTGPLTVTYPGKGTEKKPKKALQIPAGDRTITASISMSGTGWSNPKEAKYNFVAGRTYQMNVTTDFMEVQSFEDVSAAMRQTAGAVFDKEIPLKFEFIDITKK